METGRRGRSKASAGKVRRLAAKTEGRAARVVRAVESGVSVEAEGGGVGAIAIAMATVAEPTVVLEIVAKLLVQPQDPRKMGLSRWYRRIIRSSQAKAHRERTDSAGGGDVVDAGAGVGRRTKERRRTPL
jgi:hypothetical protein